MTCYCGTNKTYDSCCKVFHLNGGKTETAEQLMRSRYSAFVLANGDYLMQTHHKSTRPLKEKEAIVNWAKSVEWIKLEVLETTEDTVKFNAFFSDKGEADCIHENSKFIKENAIWYYLGYAENK